MIFKPILATSLAGFALLATPASGQNLTSLGSPQLDKYIEQQMFHNVPGLAALVVKDGAVIWSKGYGFADIAQQIPITADTVFHIGSISKPVVATAVMQLWEAGEFGLDDDVNDYLSFPVRNPQFPDAPITFRMLLQHTSGMTDFGAFANIHLISLGADSPMTLGEYLEGQLVPSSPTFNPAIWSAVPPGAAFQYSNPAWALLAYLVERISSTPFDQYCTANIFVPLGMNQTTWRLGDLFAANIAPAIPYFWLNTAHSFQIPIGHHSFPNYAAAGLRTSANDLSKFLLAHMNGGTHNGVSILQPETVELMQTMVVVAPLGWGFQWGYGFGFEINLRGPQQEQPMVGHGGATLGGNSTAMYFRPEQGVGAIVLANGYGGAVLSSSGFQDVPGKWFPVYSFIPERLLNEAAAQP